MKCSSIRVNLQNETRLLSVYFPSQLLAVTLFCGFIMSMEINLSVFAERYWPCFFPVLDLLFLYKLYFSKLANFFIHMMQVNYAIKILFLCN